MDRNEWSIHFNLTKDLDMFTGDGGDKGQVAKAPDGEWIELFHPVNIKVTPDTLNDPDFFQPGYFTLRAPCQHEPAQLQARAQRPLLSR